MGSSRQTLLGLPIFLLSGILTAADRPVEIPFKLHRGYTIVVRGETGELKKLNFVVDTGAAPSVVDLKTARKPGRGPRRE